METQDLETFATELAKESVNFFLGHKKYLPVPERIPEMFQQQRGAFVTIKKNGELRGCIGTIVPQTKNTAEEIIKNAVSAAFHDPRFPPVSTRDLPYLTFSVDVLQEPEAIASIHDLDPHVYGVIVKVDRRSGLLLPDIEGIDDAAQQVDIAKQKAGIFPWEKVELQRFTVTRYGKK